MTVMRLSSTERTSKQFPSQVYAGAVSGRAWSTSSARIHADTLSYWAKQSRHKLAWICCRAVFTFLVTISLKAGNLTSLTHLINCCTALKLSFGASWNAHISRDGTGDRYIRIIRGNMKAFKNNQQIALFQERRFLLKMGSHYLPTCSLVTRCR